MWPRAVGCSPRCAGSGVAVVDTVRGPRTRPARGGTLVVAISVRPRALEPRDHDERGDAHGRRAALQRPARARRARRPRARAGRELAGRAGGRRLSLPASRDGVTWHDGTPFTSADVKFSFEEVLLKFHARTKASMGGVLAGIDTPDDRTVVFRFKQPYAPLLFQLDATEAPIVARHIYQGQRSADERRRMRAQSGRGPFKFVSYTEGRRDPAGPQSRRTSRRGCRTSMSSSCAIIPDVGTQVLALENGEVDFLVGGARPSAESARRPMRASAWPRPRTTPAGPTAS